MGIMTRRAWIGQSVTGALALASYARATDERAAIDGAAIRRDTFAFIDRCRRDDGGYVPSPDSTYRGKSDTKLSDLAGVTYAAVLAQTFGQTLPRADRSIAFLKAHQKPDGRFVNHGGEMDPASDLAVLYNTTQGVVGLRALGARPEVDPTAVIERMVEGDAYKKLPWYTTSFFPLFYAALGSAFPDRLRKALGEHLERNQAADGYVGDHVAAAFHMAHFYRLLGEPTPKAGAMVERALRDQKSDGGWNIKAPDWDVHAAFDAVFILRQLGGESDRVHTAIRKGAEWSLGCRNADGGFAHFPGRPSDMDAVYFQFGTVIQAGLIPGVRDLPDAQTLGWGHAMQPGRVYRT